jgi:hypothetical protein
MAPEDYDKLSPEERDLKDKENRAREQREQAGIYDRIYSSEDSLSRTLISSPLHMEARTWRSRYRGSHSKRNPCKRFDRQDRQKEALGRS